MAPKTSPHFRLRIRCQQRNENTASTSQKKHRKPQNGSDNVCSRQKRKPQNDLDNACSHKNKQNRKKVTDHLKKKSRTQNWRDELEATDPNKYQIIKESSKTYSQFYRLNMSLAEKTLRKRNLTEEERKEAEMWLERKNHYNKASNRRQKKYAAKKKLEKEQNKNKPAIPLTRQKADKKKEYEKNKKRNQRARYTAEKHEAVKTRRRELYAEKKEKVQNRIFEEQERRLLEEEKRLKYMDETLTARQEELQRRQDEITAKAKELEQREQRLGEESPSKGLDMRNNTARRQSLHRAKSCMPEKVPHFVGTVVDIINKASPRTSSALKEAGVEVKKSKRRLSLEEAVTAEVAKSLSENPKKRKLLGSSLSLLKKYKLQRKACKSFKISKKLLRSNKKMQGRKKVDYQTVQTVKKYYEVNSTQIPDKKLVSKKTGKPLHVLDRPVGVLYKQYLQAHPEKPVGKSVFFALRPKNVHTKRQAQYYGCLCEYCENIELKLKVLAGNISDEIQSHHLQNIYKLTDFTLCEKTSTATFHRKTCILRECNNCGVEKLNELKGNDGDKKVEWKRWELIETEIHTNKKTKMVKKRSLVVKDGKLSDLVEELKQEAKPFSKHLFDKDWQQKQQKDLLSNLPANSILSILDFSENYKCSFQREVQSAYYSQDSSSLHPIVSYYRCPTCSKLVQESSIMISNDLTHDYHLVNTFQEAVVTHLKNTRQLNIKTLYRFSDGCSSQYKSKGPFSDISHAFDDFGFVVHHNFFGTRHGKGPSDGEGAVVKSQASMAVLAGTAIISSAKSLWEFSRDNLTKEAETGKCCREFLRTSFYIPFEEVNRDRGSRHVKTVKGTRMLHSVKTVEGGKIATRNLTCMCNSCINDGSGICSNSMYVDDWKVVDLRDKRNSNQDNADGEEDENGEDGDIGTGGVNADDNHGEDDDIGEDGNISRGDVIDDDDHDGEDDDIGKGDNIGTDDDDHGTNYEKSGEDIDKQPITGLKNGMFVAVRFASQPRNIVYLAMVNNTPTEGVALKFLRRNNKGDYYFTEEKEHTHPIEDIVTILSEPTMPSARRGIVYTFVQKELDVIAKTEQAVLK